MRGGEEGGGAEKKRTCGERLAEGLATGVPSEDRREQVNTPTAGRWVEPNRATDGSPPLGTAHLTRK